MKELDIHSRFKVVVRQSTGKVQQVHETTGSRATLEKVHTELSWMINHKGNSSNSVTVTRLGD